MKKKDIVDKTKENIGISKLDEHTKKELFGKFVDSGGEVIDEREKRRHLIIDREKQKEYQKKIDKRIKKFDKTYQKKKKSKSTISNKNLPIGEINPLIGFFNKVRLRIKLRLLRVIQLNGYYFHITFFRKFNNVYKRALMEIQILYLEIFRRDPTTGRRIITRLDNIKPLHYELIEMLGNVFDEISSDRIVEHYVDFPDIPQKVSELKEPLMEIYRKLYLLNPYENTIINSFSKAIDFYAKIENNTSSSYSSMRRKMKNDVFIIFHKLFPKLHLLFCHYYGGKFDYFDPKIEGILSIAEAEKPGNRMMRKNNDEVSVDDNKDKTTETDEVEDAKSKAIKNGLILMSKLDINKLRREYDRSRLFENVSDSDKVLLAYILFNEFDKEYSFILTTNKIKYNIDFGDRAKSDFKARLNDLYAMMRKSSDSLKEYAEVLENYEKARREKPGESSQYIEYTKRLENVEKKKKISGKNALLTVKKYMDKISDELKTLLDDMDGSQKYIENPQDILEFETDIEGDKKINGKRIYEAIYIVYCYVTTFVYRLDSKGDLSGKLEFNKEELDLMEKERKSAIEPEEMEDRSQKSIFDELDDIL